jgi:ribosomal protein S18 acetylase RimI-like enzyme
MLRRVADGLVGVWEQQASWVEGAQLYRPAGMVVAATGLGPGLDTAIAAGDGPADPGHALDVAATLLAAHGAPLWLDLVAGTHPVLEQAARDRGMRPVVRRPVMVSRTAGASDDRPDGRSPDDGRPGARVVPGPLQVARVDDVAALRSLYAECFGLPRRYAEQFLTPAALTHPASVRLVWRDPVLGVVAMAAAHLLGAAASPTGTASAGRPDGGERGKRRPGGEVAIFGVATHPALRRRGIAGRLVRAAVAVGAGRGADLAWLMAEPDAVGAYRSVGFEVVGSQEAWAGRG